MRVLVAEPDKTVREPLRAALGAFERSEVHSAEELLRTELHWAPDCLVLGLSLALDDELLDYVAKIEVPTIVVCRDPDEARAQELLQRGVSELVKWDLLGSGLLERSIRHVVLQQRRENLLQSIVNSSPVGALIADGEGLISFAGAAIEDIFGYGLDEVVGQSIECLIPSGLDRDALFHHRAPLSPGERVKRLRSSLVGVRKDGSEVPLEIQTRPILRNGIESVLVNLVDVSERVALQGQLQRAQRMEAVGRLAGGVAHDFNNLLTAILCFGNMVQRSLDPNSMAHADMDEVLKAAKRAESLTGQLLAFSRQHEVRPGHADVNEIIRDLQKMLERVLGEDMEVAIELQDVLWPVWIDRGALEQVLINLALNARDAAPRGGRLLVTTDNHCFEEDLNRKDGLRVPADCYVKITVEDRGESIPPEHLAHLFEPFYGETSASQSSGLSLSMCYGLVVQAGGYIWAENHPEGGNRFTILLPKSGAIVDEASRADESSMQRGTECILLVEDDEQVRLLSNRVLGELGYQVIDARDGCDAIDKLEDASTPPIDLLVSDVVMPRMSGKELATRVVERQPKAKVLFMSGYTSTVLGSHGVLEADDHLLRKPFSPSELATQVRKVLDGEGGQD